MTRAALGVMFAGLLTVQPVCLGAAESGPGAKPPAADADSLRRWQEMRFGMFIHWGPVSLKGTEIGWSRGKEVPKDEYDQLYTKFNPTRFDADEWVEIAKAAGMQAAGNRVLDVLFDLRLVAPGLPDRQPRRPHP